MAQKNEIHLVRLYDAPVKTVWDAYNDPVQAAKWWGPRGFTITHKSKDLKPGGSWVYVMHGPDGVDYPNHTRYREVELYKKLVYEHGANDDQPFLFLVKALFSDVKGKTQLDLTFAFDTEETTGKMKKFIKKAGGDATWDRLAEYLEKDKDIFVINRAFDASIDVVFDMWANPEHLSQWLAPTGFRLKFLQADIKKGGSTAYSMTADNGSFTMYGRAEYQEIERPNRIVYAQWFTDEKGGISRHPHAPTWPETMLTTVTFAEEGENRTRVTVRWEVYGKATSQEIEAFKKERPGMTQGWTGSFDKLEEYLGRVGVKA